MAPRISIHKVDFKQNSPKNSCFKFPPTILWDCFSPCLSNSPYYELTPKKSLHKNTRTTPSYALKMSFSTFFSVVSHFYISHFRDMSNFKL